MSLKTFRGRTRMLGPAFTQELPINIDPVINEGALVYGEDGIHWFSDGAQWRSLADLVPEIRTPKILSPEDGDIVGDPSVTIEGGPRVALYPFDLPFIRRRFQIQEAGGLWDNPVVDQIVDADDYSLPTALNFQTAYEVRIQDIRTTDGKGSYWSAVVGFSTANNVVTPINQLPENGAIDVAGDSQLIASAFEYAVDVENHVASQFRIYRNGILADDSGLLPAQRYYEPPASVINETNSTYTWQARYQGDVAGWSEWSELTEFTDVRVRVLKPENVLPSNGSNNIENTSVTLQSTVFDVVGTVDTHDGSEWEIYRNGIRIYTSGQLAFDLTSHDVPVDLLDGQKTYTWRVRHKGVALPWSDWSEFTSFTPYEAFIERPEGTSPVGDELVASNNTVLQSSVFSVLYGSDTHVASQWRIYNALTDELMHDSGEFSATLTQYTAPAGFQVQGEIYRWEVRYKGANLGWTDWSIGRSWTTAYRIITQPTNIAPPAGDNAIDRETISLTSSAFEVQFGTDSHESTQWQIRRASDDLIAFDSGADDVNKTQTPVPSTNIQEGVLYKWHCRHRGFSTDWSEWSDYTTFSVINYVVQKPTPLSPTDGATDLGAVVKLVADAFVTPDPTESHLESEFRVVNLATGVTVSQFPHSTSPLTEATIPVSLDYNSTQYSWQVRYRGSNLGWSEWSDAVTFITAQDPSYFIKGSLEHPENDTGTTTLIFDLYSASAVPNTLGRVGANYNYFPAVDGWVWWMANDGIRRREQWGIVEELVYAFPTALTTTFQQIKQAYAPPLVAVDYPMIYFGMNTTGGSNIRLVKFNVSTMTMEWTTDWDAGLFGTQLYYPWGGTVINGTLYYVLAPDRGDNDAYIAAIDSAGVRSTPVSLPNVTSTVVNAAGVPWVVSRNGFHKIGISAGAVVELTSVAQSFTAYAWCFYNNSENILLSTTSSSTIVLDLTTEMLEPAYPFDSSNQAFEFGNYLLRMYDVTTINFNDDEIMGFDIINRVSDPFYQPLSNDSAINGFESSVGYEKVYTGPLPSGV